MESTLLQDAPDVLPSAASLTVQQEATYRLFLLAARTGHTPAQVAELKRWAAADVVDWEQIGRLAGHHGVQPLVTHILYQHCEELLPPEVQANIEQLRRAASLRNVIITKELERLLAQFEAEGIPALPLKGPMLALTAYGSIHLRRYTDLDVLIPPRHFQRAEKLLLSGDYVPFEKVRNLTGAKRKLYHYLSGQWPFKRGNGAFNVDLHTHIMPPGYYYPVPFEAFWERSATVTLRNKTVRRFAPEDMLQILCFHGVKNQWRALKHVCDVAALIVAVPELDWVAVLDRAERIRGQQILLLGLALGHRVLEAPLPAIAQEQIMENAPVRKLAGKLANKLIQDQTPMAFSYEDRVQLQMMLQDTLRDKIRYSLYSLARNIWNAWLK